MCMASVSVKLFLVLGTLALTAFFGLRLDAGLNSDGLVVDLIWLWN